MKKLFIFIFMLMAALSYSQQKYALVIGNGNYTNFGRLTNSLNDANDMATVLQELGFTVEIIIDGNRAQMADGIIRLKNRLSMTQKSYGFFYYAGHGLQHNGINYLIPSNADIPSANFLGDTSISVQTMLAELNDARNELNIIVLDACRDFPSAWSRSMNRGLSVITNQPADSIIVYSTSAGSVASDGTTGRNGLFTNHLLNQLRTPGLNVHDIFNNTGAAVTQESNRQQIPAIYSQYFNTAYLGSMTYNISWYEMRPLEISYLIDKCIIVQGRDFITITLYENNKLNTYTLRNYNNLSNYYNTVIYNEETWTRDIGRIKITNNEFIFFVQGPFDEFNENEFDADDYSVYIKGALR